MLKSRMLKRSITRACTLAMAIVMTMASPLSHAQDAKGKKSKSQSRAAAKGLTEEQKAVHLLDRATFGPRPGDVERVLKMGWQKYLDEQLHPERISDDIAEQKLRNIESYNLSNAELAKYYPPPQVIQQALKSRGLEFPAPGANQADPTKKEINKALKNPDKLDKPGKNDPPEQMEAPAQPPYIEQMRRGRELAQALAEMGYKPPQKIIQDLQQARITRAVYSERQLQEVMTDFWFNHFNVFIQKGADRVLTTSYERDVIKPGVFGKFADLLKATAESPAMLFYLDNWMSASPNSRMAQYQNRAPLGRFGQAKVGELEMPNQAAQQPQRRARGINENYAREIMELHTLGVDGGYTQKDVQEVARCFTGWTLRNPRNNAEFIFVPMMHDNGEKTVLGHKIPAGGGKKDGEMVIDILAHHPSTAKFISTKLARKFVSDNPPQSLVDRMTQTFLKTDGDIREVILAMFNSPEFQAPENYRAKIKTPLEMTVSAVRAIGAETNGGPAFHRWIAQMGEGLFMAQPPTGYPDTADHWVNTGALLERMNFALALSGNRIPGARVDLSRLGIEERTVNSANASQVVDKYVTLLLRGQISAQTRATIDKSINDQLLAKTDTGAPAIDSARIVGLILGSPEFQRQ